MKSRIFPILLAIIYFCPARTESNAENQVNLTNSNLTSEAAEQGRNAISEVENWINQAKTKMTAVLGKASDELKQIASTTGEFVQGKADELGHQFGKIVTDEHHKNGEGVTSQQANPQH